MHATQGLFQPPPPHGRGGRAAAALCVGLIALAACPQGPGGDGGPGDAPAGLTARIDVVDEAPLGARVELHGEGSTDDSGKALLFAWRVRAPSGAGCAGELTGASAPIAVFVPACVGTYDVTLTINDTATASATFEVVQPAAPVADIATIARAWRAFPTTLDASATVSVEQDLAFTWTVTTTSTDPACAGSLVDADAAIAVFTPSCAVQYTAAVEVATPSGQGGRATTMFTALEPLVATFAPIEPVAVGEGAVVVVHLAGDAAPDGTAIDVVLAADPATSIDPQTAQLVHDGEAGDDATFTVTMAVAHATYGLTAHATAGAVAGAEVATSVVVANSAPVVANLHVESAFEIGESFALIADVADADADVVACSVVVVSGPDPRPSFTGDGIPVSGRCTFLGVPPAGVLAAWRVEVTASDGTASQTAGLDVAPNDLAPTASVDAVADVAYACDGSGCAAQFTVNIQATDDFDAPSALVYALRPADSAALPPGVSFVAVPSVSVVGRFDVTISRADLGPMKGTYAFEAVVTEATSPFLPLSVVQPGAVVVLGAPVVLAPYYATPAEPHSYSGGRYRAHFDVEFDAYDPESNALTRVVEVESCPGGAVGTALCGGGADVVFTESSSDGRLVLDVDAATIGSVVGTWMFRVTATDADGDLATETRAYGSGNQPPALAGGLPPTNAAQQVRQGDGSHVATFTLAGDAVDPDGNPVIFSSLVVVCPELDVIDVDGSATCATGATVAQSGATMTVTYNVGETFLGAYGLSGDIFDGLAGSSSQTLRPLAVQNAAPALTRTSSANQTLMHMHVAGTITNETGTAYSFTGDATDANGDLLTLVSAIASPWTLTGTPPGAAVPGLVEYAFGITTTLASYKANPNTVNATFKVVDEFGAESPLATVQVLAQDRAPTMNMRWGPVQATGQTGLDGIKLNNTLQAGTLAGWVTCPTCGTPAKAPIDLEFADLVDLDGDPIGITTTFACGDTVDHDDMRFPDGGTSLGTYAAPANGKISLVLLPSTTSLSCPASKTVVRYQNVAFVDAGTASHREIPFSCTGQVVLTDGVGFNYIDVPDGAFYVASTGAAVACP